MEEGKMAQPSDIKKGDTVKITDENGESKVLLVADVKSEADGAVLLCTVDLKEVDKKMLCGTCGKLLESIELALIPPPGVDRVCGECANKNAEENMVAIMKRLGVTEMGSVILTPDNRIEFKEE